MAKETLSVNKNKAPDAPALKEGETLDNATGEIVSDKPAKKAREYKTRTGVELLNKITAKSVMGDDFMSTVPTAPETMFTLIGVVREAKLNTKSQYGDSFEFKGNFKAIRELDKKQFESGKLYLPKALEDMVAQQIQSVKGEDGEDVQFVVRIGRKPSKKGSVGYEYTYEPVLQVVEYDPLEALEQAAQSALGLLTGPKA